MEPDAPNRNSPASFLSTGEHLARGRATQPSDSCDRLRVSREHAFCLRGWPATDMKQQPHSGSSFAFIAK